jgi:hypothetical protein
MNSQPKAPRAAKRPRPVLQVKQRREPKLAHADIVRMAKVEAESRACVRHDMIATAAYFRAHQRGFEPGHELEDWLAAETEIIHSQQLELIASGAGS